MALFQKADASLRAQRDLEAALKAKIGQRDDNATRLKIADTKLTEARANVERLALEADEAKLDRALEARRASEDKLAALNGAALKINSEVADIEAQIAAAIDALMRKETSAAVLEMASELEVLFGDFDNVARALQEADAWEAGSSLMSPDVGDVRSLVMKVREGLQNASAHALASLKSHAAAVLAGTARPSLPQRPAPAPKLAIVPPAPTLTLLSMRKLKYVNADGGVTVLGAYHKHDFPKALGELALKTNVAALLTDKRVRDLAATSLASVGVPEEQSCEWLGERGAETPSRYLRPGATDYHSLSPSPFTPVDRGPPIVGAMPAQQFAVGTRKLDTEEE
jgi:hypothetical protein